MSETLSTAAGAIPPPRTLIQMATSYWVSQALYVAAKLGVADLLAGGPRLVEDLAAATHSDAPTLRRVLRALASVGVFTEVRPGTFALTPLAALLQSGTPNSLRPLIILFVEEESYRAWGNLLHSVQTGEPAFERQYGMNFFAYLAQHPEADRGFNEGMTAGMMQRAVAVVDVYDFTPFKLIVDVGGSYGILLAGILRRNPAAQGILFDQPHVVAAAREQLAAAQVAERCMTVGSDFFVEVPAGGDAYVLCQILHDWDDKRSIAILRQVRRAMPAHGKLVVVELVLPPGEEPSFGKWLDLHMLVMVNGRERTAGEFDALFRAAGFALARVVPTAAGASIVEAVPV